MFMLVYMSLGAKLGVVTRQSIGTLVAARAGRWLAVLIGLSVFFISAAFQFGNNLGVHSAFQVYVDVSTTSSIHSSTPCRSLSCSAFEISTGRSNV